jgi:ribosomal protein S18 acetylase RimI-like enzyme
MKEDEKGFKSMIDIREYEQIASDSGAYKDIELEILKETLVTTDEHPGDPFHLVEVRDGRVLAGFAVFSKASNTEFTYDDIAFCVEGGYRDKGIGQRLIELVEEELLKLDKAPILRFETSLKKEEAMGKGLLESCGFALIGHIADFYGPGDDYYIYARHLAPDEQPKTGE